jgi:3(or 17)beta-hydroxysteroid dehydrogenase
VHPTFVESDMVEAMLRSTVDPVRTREKMTQDIPLRRFARPQEIADLTIYLLSDESSFITGAEMIIDGGLSAR